MNKLSLSFAAIFLVVSVSACATDEKAPMPQTRGMQGMDPAQHMRDCHSSDEAAPVKIGPHQHKTP